MSIVWTCHLCCFSCGKEFIINRVTVADASAAAALVRCPHCGAAPDTSHPHRVSYLQSTNLPYRKKTGCQVWHFSQYCSHWPKDDYVEIDYPPAGQICNECRALVGT
jgi:DNA-directed RNA polymerase subunit RPC12/RpoP